MGFVKGLKKGFKSTRKFGNKMAKGAAFGMKKASKGAEFIGDAMVEAGEITGNENLIGAGELLQEGGQLAGMTASSIEKLRTIKTSSDAAEVIADGFALFDRGSNLYAKVQ